MTEEMLKGQNREPKTGTQMCQKQVLIRGLKTRVAEYVKHLGAVFPTEIYTIQTCELENPTGRENDLHLLGQLHILKGS